MQNSSRPASEPAPPRQAAPATRAKPFRIIPGSAYWALWRILHNAHILRELTAITETGTDQDVIWAQQAIDALLALKDAADAARAVGHDTIRPGVLREHSGWFRKAADAGIALNAARGSKLQKKRHALATRMRDREADYLRFARDLRVPFDNYPDVAVMPKSGLGGGVSAGWGGGLAA